ncbi:MAG: hypothetical protein EI684_21275 [Candidatus Viridilinea halotolerans]|uniref:AAA+ ATPase domain-containing protein n=1 Tax=Candidatus Viridilinea halotolerans TaxID=2491704 RepID=A0A426TRG7_9CHLR|nr:MAG: hypothetical protein EI684_21275 [Candidatus Viridilinea halotolerans]
MNTLRIPSLHIVNYRGFSDLRINKCGRVNLLVGRNNVGKTSLLEALWLYTRRGDTRVMREILMGRDEDRLPIIEELDNVQNASAALRHLFFGRPTMLSPGAAFRIGTVDDRALLNVAVEAYRMEMVEVEATAMPRQRRVVVDADQYGMDDEIRLGLSIDFDSQFLLKQDFIRIFNDRPAYNILSENREYATVMLPAGGLQRNQIAAWRDRSIIGGKKQHVLRALQLILPDVEDFDLVESDGRPYISRTSKSERIPVVKLRSSDEFIALRSLGDGMSRLFALALALVNAQDGVLLVDEIESGLHYSIQAEMWRFIIQLATTLNIQVFAATHSKDCITAFSTITKEHPEEGMLIRLGYKGDNLIAITFDEEELAAATEQDIEVR